MTVKSLGIEFGRLEILLPYISSEIFFFCYIFCGSTTVSRFWNFMAEEGLVWLSFQMRMRVSRDRLRVTNSVATFMSK